MNDLISRQAAIEAIRKIYDSVGILGEKWAVDKCQMAIKELPSAQEWIPITSRPMTEDERKEWSEKLGYDIEDDEAVIYGNLPDDGQRVLVYNKYSGEVVVDTFYDDYDGCYFEEDGEMYGITPTYWMPLPEPPKQEENGTD